MSHLFETIDGEALKLIFLIKLLNAVEQSLSTPVPNRVLAHRLLTLGNFLIAVVVFLVAHRVPLAGRATALFLFLLATDDGHAVFLLCGAHHRHLLLLLIDALLLLVALGAPERLHDILLLHTCAAFLVLSAQLVADEVLQTAIMIDVVEERVASALE